MTIMILWALLLPILWAQEAFGACPPPNAIFPCSCKAISDKFGADFSVLSCHSINSEDLLTRIVSATRGKRLFEMQIVDSSLRFLPHDLFLDTTFEVISIENSSISSLSDNDIAFKGLEDSLHMIEVINCSFINDWDWTQLSHLRHLMEVVVTQSELLDVVNGLNTVQHLDIEVFVFSDNKIQWMGNNVFAPFEFLTRLTLDRNYIKELQRSMFPRPANNLKILGLSYNKLTSLPPDIFLDMPALSSLYLTGNPLRTIDQAVFGPIWNQINLFFFYDTPLACDCRISWITKTDNSRKYIHAQCSGPAHVKGKPVVHVQSHELWC